MHFTRTHFQLSNNTIAYHNLPQKLAKGIVTLEFRMRRPSKSEITTLNIYSEPFTEYINNSDKVAQLDFSLIQALEAGLDIVTNTAQKLQEERILTSV